MRTRVLGSPGFTLVEVMIALVILAVGLLSLASTGALVTRLIARAQRSTLEATAAARRLEHLRVGACRRRENGFEVLRRGSAVLAHIEWRWVTLDSNHHRLVFRTTHTATPARRRTDSLVAMIACTH